MTTRQCENNTPLADRALVAPVEIFPLPVTPLEYYYLCDDRPEYPATFLFELTFSGTLSRGPFVEALRVAVVRHPLLSANLDWNNGGRPNWIQSGASTDIDWDSADTPVAHRDGARIDLALASGLRVWVREAPGETRAIFQFHHAACDALGACQFLNDLLIAYHAQFCEEYAERLPLLDPTRLVTRDTFGVGDPNRRPSKREVWRTARHWARLLWRSPSDLSPPEAAPPGSGQNVFLDFVDYTFDAGETRRLRAAATNGATVNDLLLRDLLLVLNRWNADHGGGGRLRINLPTNLRGRHDAALPAANVISYAFIERTLGRRADPSKLLETICRDTSAIKRDRPSLLFLGGLGFACGIRGLVPWTLARRRSFATATLSNLGKLWVRSPLPRCDGKLVAGEAVLQRVSGAPPIRPLTRAGFAALDYGRQITITLRCDPASFSREQSQALLDRFLVRLRQSIQEGQRRPLRPR